MDEYINFPTILFLSLTFISVILSIYSFKRSFQISQKKIDFWNHLGTSFLTVASIFIAATTILISIAIKKVETETEKSGDAREKIIRELVQWEANVLHIPENKILEIELICYKTEHTLSPKTINVTIEIVYQDEYKMPASHPVRRIFNDIRLEPISDNKLNWKIDDIKNYWDEFKDSRGFVAEYGILEKPLSINFEISYNLDMYAGAQANLYPEIINDSYIKKGLTMNVVINQISPKIGG
jgi:hypothetical protein